MIVVSVFYYFVNQNITINTFDSFYWLFQYPIISVTYPGTTSYSCCYFNMLTNVIKVLSNNNVVKDDAIQGQWSPDIPPKLFTNI